LPVSRNVVSDHRPLKQHPHRSQVLLDSWFCLASLQVLDKAGDMEGFYHMPLVHAVLLEPRDSLTARM